MEPSDYPPSAEKAEEAIKILSPALGKRITNGIWLKLLKYYFPSALEEQGEYSDEEFYKELYDFNTVFPYLTVYGQGDFYRVLLNNFNLLPKSSLFTLNLRSRPLISDEGIYFFPVVKKEPATYEAFRNFVEEWVAARKQTLLMVPQGEFYVDYGYRPRYVLSPSSLNQNNIQFLPEESFNNPLTSETAMSLVSSPVSIGSPGRSANSLRSLNHSPGRSFNSLRDSLSSLE